jgi:hypothetical protein
MIVASSRDATPSPQRFTAGMADEIAAVHRARHAAHRLAPGPAVTRHRPGQPPARIHDLEAIRDALHQ